MNILMLAVMTVAPFVENGPDTRAAWVDFADRLARPILEPMSEGKLTEVYNVKRGTLELSPTWDGRDVRVAYLEAFGRLLAGLAPWFALDATSTEATPTRSARALTSTPPQAMPPQEAARCHELRTLALKALAQAVDPKSPDYLGWENGGQTLVDAAYLAEAFLRAWDALWVPLDATTKKRYIKEFEGLRRYSPPYQNWVLFCSLEECFLLKAGGRYDAYRLRSGLYKIEEWYVGDGWYSDGPSFAFDYYNAYVIHPMYLEAVETLVQARKNLIPYVTSDGKHHGAVDRLPEVLKREQKYAVILERLVSPEGTYPIFGRSVPYRMAVFQPLAQLAWLKRLPKELAEGQVRAALEAVRRRLFGDGRNFNAAGYLTLGLNGSYPAASDWYTNNGSLYMTSLFLMPLGLPATDSFWTAPSADWTSRKAWTGRPFPKDHKWDINRAPLFWE